MSEKQEVAEVAVIGAGPGGYAAAFHAADLGMNVTLIDPEPNPGGVCLYRGCIPSKALLHVASFIEEIEHAAEFGVTVGEVKIDLDKVRAYKERVVDKLTEGVGQLCKQRKINYLQGRAKFDHAKQLSVEMADGGQRTVAFEHAILATGARPVRIPAFMVSPRVMTSREALDLEDVPERLMILGGGYIGLELGQVYAALGSRVTVIEMLPNLLPGADQDLVEPLARQLASSFDAILLESKVIEIRDEKGGLHVRFETKDGKQEELKFDKVLVAVGREPVLGGTGIEMTGAVVNEQGFVEVDAQMRTAEPSVFAIGDIVGQPMLAHKASHEAIVAVEVIAGKKSVFDPRAIPAVVFTHPEVAWCGLTESEAKERGVAYEALKFPWAASGRASTFGKNDGLTKLIVNPEDGRILGVGITGVGAGELIAQGVQAIEMGAVAEDLAYTIHAHPTLSETMMEAAESFAGHSTHFMGRKKE